MKIPAHWIPLTSQSLICKLGKNIRLEKRGRHNGPASHHHIWVIILWEKPQGTFSTQSTLKHILWADAGLVGVKTTQRGLDSYDIWHHIFLDWPGSCTCLNTILACLWTSMVFVTKTNRNVWRQLNKKVISEYIYIFFTNSALWGRIGLVVAMSVRTYVCL